jgi:hypothetical protein
VATSESPAPIQSPIREKPKDVEIAKWSADQHELDLDLFNPNSTWGLVRSPFDLAAFGKGGKVIDTFGSDGVPGAACCTIYLLPPRSHYGLGFHLDSDSRVRKLEFTPTGDWVDWTKIRPQPARVSHLSTTVDSIGFPQATGIVKISGPETQNVVVMTEANLDGKFTVLMDVFDCVEPGRLKPFKVTPNGVREGSVIRPIRTMAYVTTVKGAGDKQSAPGC